MRNNRHHCFKYFLFLFLMYFLYFVIWSDSPYELPCHEYEYFVLLYFFKICTLFGQSIRTSMQNLESLAQKLSVLCSILYSLPFRSSPSLVCVWRLPDRVTFFITRYLRFPISHKIRSPLWADYAATDELTESEQYEF